MADVKVISMQASHHQCYAMTRAVLHVFRAHISVQQALDFAGALPPVLRAIFVDDWDTETPITPFPDRQTLTIEMFSIRAHHNTAPDSSIQDVAKALRQNVDIERFQSVLSKLPQEAQDFWAI